MKKLIGVTSIALIVMAFPSIASAGTSIFKTPSGNIGCIIVTKGARCDIGEHSWTAGAKPASCPYDYGNGVEVRKGKGRFTCASDTQLGQGKVLGYGKSRVLGHIKCTSTSTGMRCINKKTKHGFKVSRENVHLF